LRPGQVERPADRRLDRLDVAALGIVQALGAADRGRRGERIVPFTFDQALDLGLDRRRRA
jgi:hypothetical protein